MRILLADDHALVRAGLRGIVANAFPEATIEEVGSWQDLKERVLASPWTLLILDIALGDRNSLELVPTLREARPAMKIIVLSMYGERQFVVRALRAGVSAYVTKDRAPEELLEAIQSVLEGRRYLGRATAERLAEHVALAGTGSEALHEHLSEREFEVFLLLASARSVSEIADQLTLSVKTVSTYRSRILDKMGLDSNAQLMRYALQHGLIV